MLSWWNAFISATTPKLTPRNDKILLVYFFEKCPFISPLPPPPSSPLFTQKKKKNIYYCIKILRLKIIKKEKTKKLLKFVCTKWDIKIWKIIINKWQKYRKTWLLYKKKKYLWLFNRFSFQFFLLFLLLFFWSRKRLERDENLSFACKACSGQCICCARFQLFWFSLKCNLQMNCCLINFVNSSRQETIQQKWKLQFFFW